MNNKSNNDNIKTMTHSDIKITNVGRIKKEIALNLNIKEYANKNIVIVSTRKSHMKKHRAEFVDFEKTYAYIPKIIERADYVGLHPDGKSLQYIKKTDKNVLVAVSLVINECKVKTMYTITERKLKNYLASGRLIKL